MSFDVIKWEKLKERREQYRVTFFDSSFSNLGHTLPFCVKWLFPVHFIWFFFIVYIYLFYCDYNEIIMRLNIENIGTYFIIKLKLL